MTADEYDALIDDPSDFWVRTFLPRMCGAFEGLKMIFPWTDLWEVVLVSTHMIPFGIPPVQNALQAMLDAGNEAMAWIQKIGAFDAKQQGMGFPGMWGGTSKAPFDILADTLRGTRAIMLDMYRQPKKLERPSKGHPSRDQPGRPRRRHEWDPHGLHTPPQRGRRVHVR